MSDEIKPRYIDGEPVCSSECPRWDNYTCDHPYMVGVRAYLNHGHCSPALRRDRDAEKARAEAAEAEVARLEARILAVIEKVKAEPVPVEQRSKTIWLGRLQVADEIRAALAAKED